ncbi:hypothetical protein [Vibrio profundi]
MNTFDFIKHICASMDLSAHMVAAFPTSSDMTVRNTQDKPN